MTVGMSPAPATTPGASPDVRRRDVLSPSGPTHVRLAVREYGVPADEASAHLVLLHGYPERQDIWLPVVAALFAARPDLHVVTYDYRGAGESDRPVRAAEYVGDLLVDDLVAVLDATVPDGAPVHLVGHDWGSVQLWDAIAAEATGDPRLAGRIASYTSISGPPLDHLADVLRGRTGTLRTRLSQALHSWYVYLFLLPGLAEAGTGATAQRLGRPLAPRLDPTLTELAWGEQLASDARDAVKLYRANVLARLRRPKQWTSTVPVLLLLLRRDGFIVPASLDGLERRCPDLRRATLDSGHFLMSTRGAEVAERVLDHVAYATSRPTAPGA